MRQGTGGVIQSAFDVLFGAIAGLVVGTVSGAAFGLIIMHAAYEAMLIPAIFGALLGAAVGAVGGGAGWSLVALGGTVLVVVLGGTLGCYAGLTLTAAPGARADNFEGLFLGAVIGASMAAALLWAIQRFRAG